MSDMNKCSLVLLLLLVPFGNCTELEDILEYNVQYELTREELSFILAMNNIQVSRDCIVDNIDMYEKYEEYQKLYK